MSYIPSDIPGEDDYEDPHIWTPQDIRSMPMEEYKKLREHLFHEIDGMTDEERRTGKGIKKPRPPFHFTSF